jgi:uncharacterized cupredoxin-like copper-binding protein
VIQGTHRRVRARLAAAVGLASIATLAIGPGSVSAAGAAPRAVVKPVTVNVSAGEYYFTLSKKSIPKPGVVMFVVTNKGQIAHDFEIQALHVKTKLLQPKQKQTIKVTFKKKGSFYFLCTVPRHASEGMAGSFIVK